MDGFIDQRMSLRVASGFVGGPEWKTTINALANGRERRNRDWAYPRQRYTASVGAFSEADRSELLAMFYACAGQWGAFRFSDRVDYVASSETIQVVPGSKDPAQLLKTYTFGPTAFSRPIRAPVAGSVRVFTGAMTIAGVCDHQTGIFTPTDTWPSTPVQWSGQFDVWVRFLSDYSSFTAVRNDLLTADIELLEVSF